MACWAVTFHVTSPCDLLLGKCFHNVANVSCHVVAVVVVVVVSEELMTVSSDGRGTLPACCNSSEAVGMAIGDGFPKSLVQK